MDIYIYKYIYSWRRKEGRVHGGTYPQLNNQVIMNYIYIYTNGDHA